jgi:hypothetical protein
VLNCLRSNDFKWKKSAGKKKSKLESRDSKSLRKSNGWR